MPSYNDLRPPEDFKDKDYELFFQNMQPEQKKRTI